MIERHEHYDQDGNLTGTTVVTRESPWTESDRDAAYALWQDEQERCPQCGGYRDECAEPRPLYPQRHVCWKKAAQEVLARRWHAKHEKAEPDGAGYLPTDGVVPWLSEQDLTPDDDFLD